MPQDDNQRFEPFSEEEEEWIREQRERASAHKTHGEDEADGDVNINSLMDILVVLLVFLLKSFGDQPVSVTGTDLKVPTSTAKLPPEDMTTVTISRKYIVVNDKEVVQLNDGSVDKSQKKGGSDGLIIQPLLDRLTEVMEKQKKQARQLNQTHKPMVTLIADQSTPYRLLTEVMYTASNAELTKFKFATVKSNRDRVM